MAPTNTLSPNTIFARQSTSDQTDNGHSVPVAAAVAPIVIGIAVSFFFCAFCLRRRSRYAATHNAATTNSSTNHLSLRRNNNNGGVVRNDTQNGEDGPPAYTTILVPPPAYTPDQPPSNHTRTDSDVEREQVPAANDIETSTRRDLGGPEEGKEPENTT